MKIKYCTHWNLKAEQSPNKLLKKTAPEMANSFAKQNLLQESKIKCLLEWVKGQPLVKHYSCFTFNSFPYISSGES